MVSFEDQRSAMVELQIARRGVRDQRVLKAMSRVPRERFVAEGIREFAYEDCPLAIAAGQTISQPYIVAKMVELAEVGAGDRVLEVGSGSGYAAAVIGQIAAEVYAVERHSALADASAALLAELGYDNVHVSCGDATNGLAEHAPFDAIIVSAGGPAVPEALKSQLAPGGRLVMPVGENQQRLIKVVRKDEHEFDEQMLDAVNFVPLIGEQGWKEDGRRERPSDEAASPLSLHEMVAAAAEPFADFHDAAFAELFDRWADKRIVMLGEASHGTHEFYAARAAITQRLIERHGFTIVAVEADWPDAARVDRYVRHRVPARDPEPPFERFPTWMWRNRDMQEFFHWLRDHNDGVGNSGNAAGFYGLDLYNMQGSIAAVLDYLDRVDPDAAATARERYTCLTPWQHDPAVYGRAVLTDNYRKCEEAVVAQCRDILAHRLDYAAADDGDEFLDAAQNARLIASAEQYYRIMYYGGAKSWNLRDSHMFETLANLLETKGPAAKAVVWAHNSHIGDARHTEMGLVRGEHNIGQLARERFGSEVALIGFGTHTGTVAAASDWDGEMEIMQVRPSLPESYERLCHDAGISRFLLDFADGGKAALRDGLRDARLERFIGVIYRPDTERLSHYTQAILPDQFDCYVWLDKTSAVEPLAAHHLPEGVPDTYPFGL